MIYSGRRIIFMENEIIKTENFRTKAKTTFSVRSNHE